MPAKRKKHGCTKIHAMRDMPQRGTANVSKTSQRIRTFDRRNDPLNGSTIETDTIGRQLSDESNVPMVLSRDVKKTLLAANRAKYVETYFRLAHYDLSPKEKKRHEKHLRIYQKRIDRLK